jgi:asparagine synthase (glutamine-hydrolysing)
MCGIFGILQHRSDAIPDQRRLELTARLLEHRGPDHQAIFADAGIGLAYSRLALLDLNPRSNQPFWDETGRYGLVYNGQIYNFAALRSELAADGVLFRTTGDTEVLLESLIYRGVDATLPKLEGMFAFGFYDAEEGSLTLARDRFGIKPLYVYDQDDIFVFASEIAAMRPWIPFEPDLLSISSYLQGFGVPTSGHSFYRHVRIVPPGTIVRVSRRGRGCDRSFWRLHQFWDPGEVERLRTLPAARIVDEVDAALTESVRLRLLADAPVAALCSGGVDSAVVAAMASRVNRNIIMFHADVVGPHSEREAAVALSRHLKLDLKIAPVVDQDSIDSMAEVMCHYGHPYAYHPNSVPFLIVSRLVRDNGVKAVVSGEGSDESFIGYPWTIFDLRAFLLRLPGSLQAGAYRMLRDLTKRALRRPIRRLPVKRGGMVQALHNRFEVPLEQEDLRRALRRLMGAEPTSRDLVSLEQLGYHLRTLLHRNDCLGMAASVEARFPFLDTRLVRLAVNVPYRVKVRPSPTALAPSHLFLSDKWVLRKVAERYLPPSLAWRPKQGFPIGAGARMRIAPELFDHSFVANLFELGAREVMFMATHADRDLLLRLLHLEVWGRVCLEGMAVDDMTYRLQEHVMLQ